MDTIQQFASKIKSVHPEYNDMSDQELAISMVQKFPEYSDMVDLKSASKPVGPFKVTGGYSPDLKELKTGGVAKDNGDFVEALDTATYLTNPVGSLAKRMLQRGIIGDVSGTATALKEGKSLPSALYQGVENAGLSAAGEYGFDKVGKYIVKPALKAISEPVAKGISKVGSLLSSVPENDYYQATKKVVKGINPFGKSAAEDEKAARLLADKVKKESSNVRSALGQESGIERLSLKAKELKNKDTPRLDSKNIVKEARQSIENMRGTEGTSLINPKEEKDILLLLNVLERKNYPILDAYNVHRNIDDELFQAGRIKGKLSPGDAIKARISNQINEQVENKAPHLFSENQKFSNQAELDNFLSSQLSNKKTRGNNILSGIRKPGAVQDALEELNTQLPTERQFMEEGKDILARAPFRNVFPGQGGGYGSAEGSANKLRDTLINRGLIAGLAGTTTHSPLLSAATAVSFSPIIHKAGLIGTSKLIQGTKAVAPLAKRVAVPYIANKADGTIVPNLYDKYMERQRRKK